MAPNYSPFMEFEINEVKDIRKRLGLTQLELAKRANVSQSLIAKIEAGRIDPTYSKTIKIFQALRDMGKEKEITAGEIMQRKMISVQVNDDLKKVIETLKRHEISQMPVTEGTEVVGTISEATILESLLNGKSGSRAKDVMAEAPPSVSRQTPVSLVSNLLRYFSIVLVAEKGKPIGLITKSDLITKMYGKNPMQ